MEPMLRQGELWTLKTAQEGVLISLRGAFWLTRSGDAADYLVGDGEKLVLPAGDWLVETMSDGRLDWMPSGALPWREADETHHFPFVSGL